LKSPAENPNRLQTAKMVGHAQFMHDFLIPIVAESSPPYAHLGARLSLLSVAGG